MLKGQKGIADVAVLGIKRSECGLLIFARPSVLGLSGLYISGSRLQEVHCLFCL